MKKTNKINMQEILKTIVGSQAHGTALPESDTDYRGVFIVDAMDFISPFRNIKTNSWIEGKEDNTSYELSHFCQLCAHGNPSALELLSAPVVGATKEGRDLRAMLPKFLSKKKCFDAFRGYSRNQEKKFRDNALDRRWKYAEAHLRTMYQLLHLLKTGELKIGWSGGTLDELCAVKRGMKTEAECMARIIAMEKLCDDAYAECTALPESPDTEAIEKFLFDIYLGNKCQILPEPEASGSGEKNTSSVISGTEKV